MAGVGQKYGISGSQGSGWTFGGGLAVPAGMFVTESAVASITAGTTRTHAGAAALAQEVNRVDTATAPAAGSTLGDGVRLMAAVAGLTILVINNTAQPVQVYGTGSDTLNTVAGATGVMLPPQGMYLFASAAAGAWTCEGIGTGASGGYPTVTAVDALTAKAGGGQAGATVCAAVINRFTTVATAADSGLLPAAKAGMQITVTNAHATNSMNLFPASGEQINSAGANVAFALAAGKTASFTSAANGAWHAVLSA
ncbi:MAG: hypothetical protein JWQ97_2595 [Phenylobacterium sp.]|nr:hypothetical protein [Phenylobacterium sp.]